MEGEGEEGASRSLMLLVSMLPGLLLLLLLLKGKKGSGRESSVAGSVATVVWLALGDQDKPDLG